MNFVDDPEDPQSMDNIIRALVQNLFSGLIRLSVVVFSGCYT